MGCLRRRFDPCDDGPYRGRVDNAPPRGRILLVDDDKSAMAGLEALLGDDFEIVTADGIADAHARLAERSYDVIVCGYQLPGGTGLDVLRHASERDPRVIGIVWTGRADLVTARAEAESFRVIPKTDVPDLILQVVRQSMALARLRASMRDLRQ